MDLLSLAHRHLGDAVAAIEHPGTRQRLGLLGVGAALRRGNDQALPVLAASPGDVQRALLRLVARHGPPATPAIAAHARELAQAPPRQTPDGAFLGLWAGLDKEAARVARLAHLERRAVLEDVVAAGVPPDLDGLGPLLAGLPPEEAEGVVIRWFRERQFLDDPREHALLVEHLHSDAVRLDVYATVAAGGAASRDLLGGWLPVATAAQPDPEHGDPRAVGSAAARLAAVAAPLTARASEVALDTAFSALERIPAAQGRVHIYDVLVRVLPGLPSSAWRRVIAALAADPLLSDAPAAGVAVRARLIAALRRRSADADLADLLDRGLALARHPDQPWLALAVLAVRVARRAPPSAVEDAWQQVEARLRAGLPEPTPAVAVDDVVAPLAAIDPARTLSAAQLLRSPLQRALWLVSTLPHVPAPASDATV